MASYGAPLLPNHGPPINFRPLPQAPPQYHHKPVFHGPKNILGIRYGSVSGKKKFLNFLKLYKIFSVLQVT